MDECIDADRLIVMSNGSIAADGKPAEVFTDYALMEREGLDIPETARLLRELREAGMKLEGEPLSVNACADLIAEAIKSERSRK